MASIVLILSHPSLGHPEATVQTHLVGQSRNLWNVGGYGLGILTSKGFRFDCSGGVGRGETCVRKKTAMLLGSGAAWGRALLAPEGTALT